MGDVFTGRVVLRLGPSEKLLWVDAAAAEGLSLSGWLRRAARQAVELELALRQLEVGSVLGPPDLEFDVGGGSATGVAASMG
jgi:hypothetical protein